MADATTVKALLARIDGDWAALRARAERLDAKAPPPASGDGWAWNVVLAHIARWENWHHQAISERLADGSVRSYEGYDRWNHAWAREDQALSLDEARARMFETHGRFRDLLGGLTPEEWDEKVVRWTETCTYEHYLEHVGDLAPA